MKGKDMSWMKKFCSTLMLGAACAGCVSDPFIADSLAKLDRVPMHCKLPDYASVVAEPLQKEKLLGEWSSGVIEAPCRHIGGNGVYDSGWLFKTREYGFFSDGSFYGVDGSLNSVKGIHREWLGNYGHLLKYRGTWSYEAAVLTLNTQYYELEISSGLGNDRKVVSRETESCNKENTFIVTCYDNGEIAIEERNPKINSSSSGDRNLVSIDNQGVRTERTVKVTGIRDGKEVGVVDEKVIPPIRFKRKEK